MRYMIDHGTKLITRVDGEVCHWYSESHKCWFLCKATTRAIVENTVATGNGSWCDAPKK